MKVRFVNDKTGWIAGIHHVYGTTNGGATWSKQDSTGGSCRCLFPLNKDTVIFGTAVNTLRRTTNGGKTWSTVNSDSFFCMGMSFVTSKIGYAAGFGTGSNSAGIVKKTTDAGSHWTTIPMGNRFDILTGLSFVTGETGWVLTYPGLIYKTTNSGASWSFLDSIGRGRYLPLVPMRDVQFLTADSGWAVGGISGDNVIARTADGGRHWQYSWPGGSSLREIQMLNRHIGWFGGANNFAPFISQTRNDGATWITDSLDPPYASGVESIWMIDWMSGWAVGSEGHIYRTTNGGRIFTGVERAMEVPSAMILRQNYPNPFNPSTIILYGLPRESFVSLRVYNVLGEEVAVLVNEVKPPGSYQIEWKATGYPSGVYFYRLSAEGQSGQRATRFVETRKLVIIR